MKKLKAYAEVLNARRAEVSLLLFFAALVVGFSQLTHSGPFGPRLEMLAIARNLADHGTFANPYFSMNTGPTAANPPLYPIMLALLIKSVKTPALQWFVAASGSIVANALTAAWLPYVSFLFFGDVIAGLFASLFWLAAMQTIPSWDTSYTVAGLLLFCLMTAVHINKNRSVGAFGALAGVVSGSLFLLNPSSIMVFLPWLIYLYTRQRAHAAHATKYCCFLIATLCLFAAAWAGRNYHELGGFVVRTNLGLTLYASNNDCAESSLIKDALNRCYQAHHPNYSVSEAQLIRTLGEIRYDQKRIADSRSWMADHPRRFLRLTVKRIREFWFPPLDESTYTGAASYAAYVIWIITALSIPGVILMAYRREPVTLFVIAVLLIYPLLYYIVVTDVRYRYPVLWLSLLTAGYCAWQLLNIGANEPPGQRIGTSMRGPSFQSRSD